MKSSLPPIWDHFKFNHEDIEKHVDTRPGGYQGLSPAALYTSQEDFFEIFSHPSIQGTFIDLGCGTGESCLLYGSLFPERLAIGIEFQSARLNQGKDLKEKFQLNNVELIEEDLLSKPIPIGDTYFLYFPTGLVLDRVLTELYERKKFFRLVAIESHGDLFQRLARENWLHLKHEIPLKSKRHEPVARVYESGLEKRAEELLPHLISYQEKLLLIKDQEEWVGESLGLEWTTAERYELKTPPRTIEWQFVQKVLDFSEVSVNLLKAVQLRRLGELRILTSRAEFHGFIRKIILKPTFRLEISSGEQVEWKDIVTIHQGSRLCYESS